ncbi:MAG: response regulator transcription factor [Sediminibacterium sp.]|nr:response regulator transcription factor [Sediminibacterium sp.]MDP3128100.1 response regulator transcription factor [Sediminibacterium sp.]
MIKVALVEDHELFRKGLVSILSNKKNVEVIFDVSNGFELICKLNFSKQYPRIIFVDIKMPIMDGVALTHYLSKHYPNIYTIALSMYSNEDKIEDMISAGAKGYIIKTNFDKHFNEAIETVLAKNIFIDKSFQNMDSMVLRKNNNNILEDFIELSKKEEHFLELCAGTDCDYSEIAKIMHVAESTLKNYKKSLNEKYSLTNRASYIRFALQHGIIRIARL